MKTSIRKLLETAYALPPRKAGRPKKNEAIKALSEKRRAASLARKHFGGGGARVGAGRPLTAPRCSCGLYRLSRRPKSHQCGNPTGMCS